MPFTSMVYFAHEMKRPGTRSRLHRGVSRLIFTTIPLASDANRLAVELVGIPVRLRNLFSSSRFKRALGEVRTALFLWVLYLEMVGAEI